MKAITLSLCSVLLLAVGCSKEETTATSPPASASETSKTSASQAADAAKKQALKAAEEQALQAALAEASKADAEEKAAAEKARIDSTSKADDLIKQAKGLVDAKKYTDASNLLQQLGTLKLTAEQQKLVEDLKTAVKNALAKQATSEGTKAVGDLLGGKK